MKDLENSAVEWPILNKQGEAFLAALARETEEQGQVRIAEETLGKMLETCLRIRFTKAGIDPAAVSKVLGGKSPRRKRTKKRDNHAILATVGAKNDVCYAFGVIGKEEYGVIDAIRKIRNEFGHADFKIRGRDFDCTYWACKKRTPSVTLQFLKWSVVAVQAERSPKCVPRRLSRSWSSGSRRN